MLFSITDLTELTSIGSLSGQEEYMVRLVPSLPLFSPIIIFNPASSSNVILKVSCHPYRFRARYS